MRRRFLTLVFLCASLGLTHGRTPVEIRAEEALVVKPKPKRVLFRTDSPRLFPPKAPVQVRPEPVKPTPVAVRVSRTGTPLAKVVPAPAAKLRTVAPVAPSLPKPELRQRTTIITPLRDEPSGARRFDIDFLPTSFTPYDRYLGTVKSVMARLDEREASMVNACQLVQECRGFRYTVTDLYRADPPAVTEARRAGDCKSKALWVYDHLGDPSAYYVIGKLVQRSRTSHAWVYWRNNGRWWILDPTIRSSPIAADTVSSFRYVPYYSYSRAGAFRHSATRLMMAANGIPAVGSTAAVRARSADAREVAPRK